VSDEKKYSLQEVGRFLLGEGELDGLWFGDSDIDNTRPRYWWRQHLRMALSQPAAVEGWQETVEALTEAREMLYQVSSSALLAGEKCKKEDAGILYSLVCRANVLLLSVLDDISAAPTLPQSEDARGADHIGDANKMIASGLLSEKVEPIGFRWMSGDKWVYGDTKPVIGAHTAEPIYTLPPTAQQALRMAADVCEEWAKTAGEYGFDGDADQYHEIGEEILSISLPTDIDAGHADTVTMTREEFKNTLTELAYEVMDFDYITGNDIAEIVAQHMPKGE
jgi:hypothetical protein